MAEFESLPDNDFVVDTIMSNVSQDASQKGVSEDVIAKLVSFYEERLHRQKEEMKDEFMKLLTKPKQSDEEVQCANEPEIMISSEQPTNDQSDKGPVQSPEPSDKPVSTEADSLTSGNEEVIEVDIRPTSSKIPLLSLGMGDFASSSSQSNDVGDSIGENHFAKEQQPLPMDVNSQVIMMMMNVLENGTVPLGSFYPPANHAESPDPLNEQKGGPEDSNTAVYNTPVKAGVSEEDMIAEKDVTKNSFDSVQLSEEGNIRPNTGTSLNTDYDPSNPLFLKPPSPKRDLNSSKDAARHDGRSVYSRNNYGDGDYPSPSTSTASVRVQLYEKHQKQIADLKAYYEEELDDLREKLRQMEERTLPASTLTNSRYTNTTPSPRKQAGSSLGAAVSTELERECSSLRLKVEWLDQAYKNTNQRLKDAEAQVDDLAAKLSTYTLRLSDASNEIEEMQHEIRGKDEEIDRLVSRSNRLLVEIDEAGRMLQIKDQSLAESDAMLNRLMREYTSMNKDFEALKTKHDGCDNAMQELKQELANSKRQINKMSFEFRRLEHENDLLTKRLQLTTSFNVAERFSTPTVSTSASSYQTPPFVREYRGVHAAGLSSVEAHGDSRFQRANSRVSAAPYATIMDESVDVDRDVVSSSHNAADHGAQKVTFKDQATQSRHDDEPAVLRAERELFGVKERPILSGDTAGKKPSNSARSPRKAQLPTSVSFSTQFAGNGGHHQTAATPPPSTSCNNLAGASNLEKQFDSLLIEKQRVEASLNRLPAAPNNQTIRANKDLLERQLEDIERRLASLRFALKKSHVIRSSLH